MDVPVKKAAVTARTPPRPGKAEVKPTTLLDVHEVEWITRELERLLAKENSDDNDAGADHRRKRAETAPNKKVGFLSGALGRHAVSICSGDAVDTASAAAGVSRVRRPHDDDGADSGRWRRRFSLDSPTRCARG
jgi:hypothetical protein